MAEKTFPLQIVSPAKIVFSGEATLVEVPGVEGDFGVLANHSPVFAMLRSGTIRVHQGGSVKVFEVTAGYADVNPEGTTILSESVSEAA